VRAAFGAALFLSGTAVLAQAQFGSVPPAVPDSLQFGAQLPDFEAKDIAGRIWRLEDLRGKFTLVYIWGTFEARATDAHDPRLRALVRGLPDQPELQRFYDTVKSGNRIQVLSFCRDYDYTHAPEYMKQAGYTFPVIADWTLIGSSSGWKERSRATGLSIQRREFHNPSGPGVSVA
jgi:hypothetical protein